MKKRIQIVVKIYNHKKSSKMKSNKSILFSEIEMTINALNIEAITIERKEILQPLVAFIQTKLSEQIKIRLIFVCTHNSRRSHLTQIWAQTAASFFNIKNVFCYSGGIEATTMFPMVTKTLEKHGFKIKTICANINPIYAIKYAENEHPIIGFSKKSDDDFNPKNEFVAIMTCSNAAVDCPFIAGAEKRIPITFEDPKAFDNTTQQAEKYFERSLQIATEMIYVFSQIKK